MVLHGRKQRIRDLVKNQKITRIIWSASTWQQGKVYLEDQFQKDFRDLSLIKELLIRRRVPAPSELNAPCRVVFVIRARSLAKRTPISTYDAQLIAFAQLQISDITSSLILRAQSSVKFGSKFSTKIATKLNL